MTPQAPAVVLLSVRPPHVDRLLNGTKKIELRRARWHVPPGSRALLYASGPTRRAIVGSVTVEETVVSALDNAWRAFGAEAAVTRREFDDYFAGASTVVAIRVTQPQRLASPITLDELRRRHPAFAPPQSFRYVRPAELSQILNGERNHLLSS